MNKRIIASVAVLSIGVAGLSACNSKATSSKVPQVSKPSISKGVGARNATADVTLVKFTPDNGFQIAQETVKVTNHSSKRSDYFISLALNSADGKTQLDTAIAQVTDLDPGQSATDNGSFIKIATDGTPVPAGAKVVIKSVQRTASN